MKQLVILLLLPALAFPQSKDTLRNGMISEGAKTSFLNGQLYITPGVGPISRVPQGYYRWQIRSLPAGKEPQRVTFTDRYMGGEFYLDLSDTTTPDDGAMCLVTGGNKRYKRDVADNILKLTWFGGVPNDGQSDQTAIRAALSYAATRPGNWQISGIPGTYTMTDGLSVSMAQLKLLGSGIKLDFSTLTTGTALSLTGVGGQNEYRQSTSGLTDLEIIGPGYSFTATTGILISSTNGTGASHYSLSGINVHGFGTGVAFGDNSYCVSLYNVNIYANTIGVLVKAGTNNGEGIDLIGCRIFNNLRGLVQENGTSDLHQIGGSLDGNGQQVVVTAGRVVLNSVHVEGKNFVTYPFSVSGDGAALYFNNCWLQSTENLTVPLAYFHVTTPYSMGGGVFLSGVSLNNAMTSSLRLADGSGHIEMGGTSSYNTWTNAPMLSDAENSLLNGGFEGGSVLDNYLVTGTATRTNTLTATNSELSISGTYARTGSTSLRHYKQFGAGSTSEFLVLIPIDAGKFTRFDGQYNKPGTATGTVFVNGFFAGGVSLDANGYITYRRVEAAGSRTLTFTASGTGWTYLDVDAPPLRAPSWATHYMVAVNASGWNSAGESMYYDDFVINQF